MWQKYHSKQFSNLFKREEKSRNYKVQAENFKNLTPMQDKSRQVPIQLLLCERLDHKITPSEITSLVRKTEPIELLKPPRTLSQFKLFMGPVYSLDKDLSALPGSSAPLRPLQSKNNDYIWTAECQCAFGN